MDFIVHIREAFANLFAAKLRSFLAILGVLVGTGSVVALISSSQLATAHALSQFKTLGTNLLAMTIESQQTGKDDQQAQFTTSDSVWIKKSSNQIVQIAPYTTLYQTVYYGDKSYGGQILGATESLASIAKVPLKRGRFISFLDNNQFYAVIGATLAKEIKQTGHDPLGQQIQVGNNFFTVIGIAQKWQPNFFLFVDIDNGIIIPISTSYLISNQAQINNVLFRLVENPDLNAVQNALKARMAELLPSKIVNFRNPEQIIDIIAKQRQTFTWLLAAIGGISLLVGGIGVMNIMLVSVVERRREIGIRMAIGARRSDILKMFLIESVILTVFGGFCGIVVGVLVSYLLAVTTGWEFILYLLPPILGFFVSALVGIVSGFYPALRASKLDPIQTLQSD